jgi:hypothetical protein
MLEAANFFVESFNNPVRIHHREYRCAGQRKRCRVGRLSFDGDIALIADAGRTQSSPCSMTLFQLEDISATHTGRSLLKLHPVGCEC